jgi:hypothetical protein
VQGLTAEQRQLLAVEEFDGEELATATAKESPALSDYSSDEVQL